MSIKMKTLKTLNISTYEVGIGEGLSVKVSLVVIDETVRMVLATL
jgi:hypothetical protein